MSNNLNINAYSLDLLTNYVALMQYRVYTSICDQMFSLKLEPDRDDGENSCNWYNEENNVAWYEVENSCLERSTTYIRQQFVIQSR